jgi:hypothetical protein
VVALVGTDSDNFFFRWVGGWDMLRTLMTPLAELYG